MATSMLSARQPRQTAGHRLKRTLMEHRAASMRAMRRSRGGLAARHACRQACALTLCVRHLHPRHRVWKWRRARQRRHPVQFVLQLPARQKFHHNISGGRWEGGEGGACVEYKDAAIKDRRSLLRQCGCRVSVQARMRVQWYSQIFSRSEDRVYLNNVWMVKLLHQLNLSTGGTHTVAHHY